MSTLQVQHLPPRCLVVWQQGWTFIVELRVKRQMQESGWYKTFNELASAITGCELHYLARRQEPPPTYLLDTATQRYSPLTYEQAQALAKAAA